MSHAGNGKGTEMETLDLGNNETMSRGVVKVPEGWLALTYTQSKVFKTQKGAEAWLARKMGK